MNVEELRSQTRAILEQTLNQLQTATLLVAELETQISEAGRTVQNLTYIVEQYIDGVTNTTTSSDSASRPTLEGGDARIEDLNE